MNATIVYNVGTDPFVQDRAYKKSCDRQYFCDGLAAGRQAGWLAGLAPGTAGSPRQRPLRDAVPFCAHF